MRTTRLALSVIFLAATACHGDPAASPDAGDSPTTALELANVQYATGVGSSVGTTGGTTTMAPEPLRLCEFLGSEDDFVGIIEVLDASEFQGSPVCTENEYVSLHKDLTVAVIAKAHGGFVDVGRSGNVVRIGSFFDLTVGQGDILLVRMRQSRGEWLMTGALIAGNPGSYEADAGEREVDLPADFSVLSSRASAIISNYPVECPDDMRQPPADDETFAERVRTPNCPSGSADDEAEDLLKDAEYVPRANNESGADAGTGDAGR